MRLLVQDWEEMERGWGSRPDGYSLHLDDEDRKRFIKAYWDKMPNHVPDEYSTPYGEPYWKDITDSALLAELEASENGIRKYRWNH